MPEYSKREQIIIGRYELAQNRLVLQASDLSLETVAAMVEKRSIDVEPRYQRRERWKHSAQSALIESFLLNIPVPPVYLAEDDFGTYSVIDGKQRLTAIKSFMRDGLRLSDLKTFVELEGASYKDLPVPLQNSLQVRPYIRAITLLKQSSPELKYEVFTRLNTGGEPLSPQEIRNVAYMGPLNDLIFELAEDEFLKKQLKITSKSSSAYQDMQDAEFVLRFLTLANNWDKFNGDYRRSMDVFMKDYQHSKKDDLKKYKENFTRSLKGCQRIWGDLAFKRPTGDGWRDQFLAGMYDAQMIAISLLSDANIKNITDQQADAVKAVQTLFTDPEFETAVRVATNTPKRVFYRIDMLRLKLLTLG